MKTKIILLFFTISCIQICELKAQSLKLKAGVGFPSTSSYWEEFDESDDFVLNIGFLIGPVYDFSINELNKLKIGAILNKKGYRSASSYSDDGYSGHNARFNLLYIDFPILYRRKFTLGNHSLFAELGPYTGIGISGKSKLEYKFDGEIIYEETKLFGKNSIDYLKNVDYGMVGGVGMNLRNWEFGLSFALGLRDISKPDFEKTKNRVVSIYAAVPLYQKKKI